MRDFDLDRDAEEIAAAIERMDTEPAPSEAFTHSLQWMRSKAEGGMVAPGPWGYRFMVPGETFVTIAKSTMMHGLSCVQVETYRQLATWHEQLAHAYRLEYGGTKFVGR